MSFPCAHGIRGIRRLDVYCFARSVFCCCCFLRQRGAVCGVRHNFQNYMQWSGNKIPGNDFVSMKTRKIPPHPNHTHVKKQVLIYGNSLYGPASWMRTKGDMSDMPSMQPTEKRRTSPPGSRVSEHMPRRPSAYVCRSALSREQCDWRSRSLKKCSSRIREAEDQTGCLGCELIY